MTKPKKQKRTNPLKDKQFFAAQLLTLTVLQSVLDRPDLNDFTRDACINAMLITSATLDRISADHPDFEAEVDFITGEFAKPKEQEAQDEQTSI